MNDCKTSIPRQSDEILVGFLKAMHQPNPQYACVMESDFTNLLIRFSVEPARFQAGVEHVLLTNFSNF